MDGCCEQRPGNGGPGKKDDIRLGRETVIQIIVMEISKNILTICWNFFINTYL